MPLAGEGSPEQEGVVESIIPEVSNTPIEIPNAVNKNILIVHVDNRLNADPTFIKLWNDPTITYATEEPDIKLSVPAGVQGAIRIPYSTSGGSASIIPQNEEWWIAASSSSAIDGAAPSSAVDVRITREE